MGEGRSKLAVISCLQLMVEVRVTIYDIYMIYPYVCVCV